MYPRSQLLTSSLITFFFVPSVLHLVCGQGIQKIRRQSIETSLKRIPCYACRAWRYCVVRHNACGAPSSPGSFYYFSPRAPRQIFFPRSIETEIAAHDAGARGRRLFSSRHHLTLISQEQELYGTYAFDPEETPVDSNADSPSSLYYKPAAFPPSSSPSQEDIYIPTYMQQQELAPSPPPPAQLPTEPIRLTPNRRRPSLDCVLSPTKKFQQQRQQQASGLAERLLNPATNVSRLKESF
jgi:hypothetical protein